jgi:hypothetical protein
MNMVKPRVEEIVMFLTSFITLSSYPYSLEVVNQSRRLSLVFEKRVVNSAIRLGMSKYKSKCHSARSLRLCQLSSVSCVITCGREKIRNDDGWGLK